MTHNKHLRIVSILLKIEAILGTVTAALISITVAAFATDSPSTSLIAAGAFGIILFALLFCVLGSLRWWSSYKIKKDDNPGFISAILFSTLIVFICFPVGTILGGYQIVTLMNINRLLKLE